MGDYSATQTVGVTVVRGGVEMPASVGLGEYTYGNDGKTVTVFGYVDDHDPDRISHMAYDLSYFKPADVLELAKAQGWFWFEAGTTRAELKISARELEVALYLLGLLDSIGSAD